MRNEIKALRAINKAPSIKNRGGSPQLITVGDLIYSYSTPVGVFIDGSIYVPTYYSVTTSRHINIVANDWNADVVKMY